LKDLITDVLNILLHEKVSILIYLVIDLITF